MWGRLENGETFLIRDTRARPALFLPREQVERARRLGARPVERIAEPVLEIVGSDFDRAVGDATQLPLF